MDTRTLRVSPLLIAGVATALGIFSTFQAYNYVRLFTERPASFPTLAVLNPTFWYHRSRIVNTERIKELQPWFNGDYVVILRDGTRLTLSRGYREKLQHGWVGDSSGGNRRHCWQSRIGDRASIAGLSRLAAGNGRPSVFPRAEPLAGAREPGAAGSYGFLIVSAPMHKLIVIALLVLLAACTSPAPEPAEPAAPAAPQALAPATAAAPQTGVASAPEIIPIDQVRKSQEAAVTQRIANTDITVTYSRPVARGRDLFGKLVPYDAIWNPGADKATSIEVTRDVEVNGQALPAGRYSVWAIPRTDNWTLMFSRMADTFHATYPGEAQDALRLDVKPEQGPHMEVLSFYFPLVEGKEAMLRLHWGTTMVPLAITVP